MNRQPSLPISSEYTVSWRSCARIPEEIVHALMSRIQRQQNVIASEQRGEQSARAPWPDSLAPGSLNGSTLTEWSFDNVNRLRDAQFLREYKGNSSMDSRVTFFREGERRAWRIAERRRPSSRGHSTRVPSLFPLTFSASKLVSERIMADNSLSDWATRRLKIDRIDRGAEIPTCKNWTMDVRCGFRSKIL